MKGRRPPAVPARHPAAWALARARSSDRPDLARDLLGTIQGADVDLVRMFLAEGADPQSLGRRLADGDGFLAMGQAVPVAEWLHATALNGGRGDTAARIVLHAALVHGFAPRGSAVRRLMSDFALGRRPPPRRTLGARNWSVTILLAIPDLSTATLRALLVSVSTEGSDGPLLPAILGYPALTAPLLAEAVGDRRRLSTEALQAVLGRPDWHRAPGLLERFAAEWKPSAPEAVLRSVMIGAVRGHRDDLLCRLSAIAAPVRPWVLAEVLSLYPRDLARALGADGLSGLMLHAHAPLRLAAITASAQL